jgi:hypothetical protein
MNQHIHQAEVKALGEVNTKMLNEIGEKLSSIKQSTRGNMIVNKPGGFLAAQALGEQMAGDD